MKPVPADIIAQNKTDPMAVINFLRAKRTVATPLAPTELVEVYISRPHGKILKEQERGYGYDCMCFGTGWIKGQVLCGRHKPLLPLHYED